MKYIYIFILLFFTSSCGEMCIDEQDSKQAIERARMSISSGSSKYVTHPDVQNDKDVDYVGEIFMNCPEEEYEVSFCPANQSCNGANIVNNAGYLNTGIQITNKLLVIQEVSGDWIAQSTGPGNKCLLLDKKEGIGCSSTLVDSIRVKISDTESAELSSFVTPETVDGEQNDRYVLSDVGDAGIGPELLLKFTHYDENKEIIDADPTLPEYKYEGNVKLKYFICDYNIHLKTDGQCIDRALASQGKFLIEDKRGLPGSSGVGITPTAGACLGDGIRKNNFGSYDIYYVKLTNDVLGDVDIFSGVISGLRDLLLGDGSGNDGITGKIYKAIVNNTAYLAFMYAVLTLSIIFFSYGYIIGSAEISSKSLVIFILKICTVLFLLSDPGWDFLRNYIVVFIVDTVPIILNVYVEALENFLQGVTYPNPTVGDKDNFGNYINFSRNPYPLSNDWKDVFTYYNLIANMLFSQNFWIKAHALIFSFPSDFFGILIGVIVFLAILFSILKVTLLSISYVVMSVAIAITTTSMVLILVPTVILFWTFERTKSSFQQVLIPYLYFSFINPLLVVMGGTIIVAIAYISLESLLSFLACTTCILEISLSMGALRIEKCVFYAYAAYGTDFQYPIVTVIENFPISLYKFIFVVVAFKLLEVAGVVMTSYALEISSVRQYSNPQNYLQQGVIGAASGQLATASEFGFRAWNAGKRATNRTAKVKR